jgi:hypothetical protein
MREYARRESHRLATEILFENPRLENVQGMILLAAYAKKAWFAIGHALQMAKDLGLDAAMHRLNNLESAGGHDHDVEARDLFRHTRTWLILHHIEREIAFGTARKPRMKPVDKMSLRRFLSLPITTCADIRYISIIELVQIRGELIQYPLCLCWRSTHALF